MYIYDIHTHTVYNYIYICINVWMGTFAESSIVNYPHSWALIDLSVISGAGLTMMPECRCRTKCCKLTED